MRLAGLTKVTAVASGWDFTLALQADGTVWAWGGNSYSQLGDSSRATPHPRPAQVRNLAEGVAIAAGEFHALALRHDGTVSAWGWNDTGQVGDGSTTHRYAPVQVPGFSGVTAISAGDNHSVALKDDGTVWAWGFDDFGQLGDSSDRNRLLLAPTRVPGLSGIVAIASAMHTTVALRRDGTVWTCGENYYGQLGDGSTTDRSTPVQVPGLSGIAAISAGGYHTAALRNDGTVWEWGLDDAGQLGVDLPPR